MRRTTNNPAFRNLPGSGYAGFNYQPSGAQGYGHEPYSTGRSAPRSADRPMTVDDVVTKTAITFGAALAAGVITAVTHLFWLALPALIVGLVVSLVIIFGRKFNPALVLTYSLAEGVLLGALTGALEFSGTRFQGIGLQAILGTAGVFAGMLVVYKTGAVRVTPRLTKAVVGALIGAVVLMLVNFVVGFFTEGGLGLRDGSPMAYLFSIVCIGLGAFILLIDFDQADHLIRAGAPAKMAWYVAFGLMMTLVWLYLEILRLLTYLRSD